MEFAALGKAPGQGNISTALESSAVFFYAVICCTAKGARPGVNRLRVAPVWW